MRWLVTDLSLTSPTVLLNLRNTLLYFMGGMMVIASQNTFLFNNQSPFLLLLLQEMAKSVF